MTPEPTSSGTGPAALRSRSRRARGCVAHVPAVAGDQAVPHLVGLVRANDRWSRQSPSMCSRRLRSPSSRKPSFSTTRSDAAFSGPDVDLDAVQPDRAEAVVDRPSRRRSGVTPRPAIRLVDPVADVRRAERPAGDPADGDLPDE